MLLYQLACIFKPVALTHLPWLPWWGWLLVMAAQWALVIWLVPMPWWAWSLNGVLMAAYLLASLVVWILESSSA